LGVNNLCTGGGRRRRVLGTTEKSWGELVDPRKMPLTCTSAPAQTDARPEGHGTPEAKAPTASARGASSTKVGTVAGRGTGRAPADLQASGVWWSSGSQLAATG